MQLNLSQIKRDLTSVCETDQQRENINFITDELLNVVKSEFEDLLINCYHTMLKTFVENYDNEQ